MYLSDLGLLLQNTTNWVSYKQQILTSQVFGGWNGNIRVPAWSGEGSLLMDNIDGHLMQL